MVTKQLRLQSKSKSEIGFLKDGLEAGVGRSWPSVQVIWL